MKCQNCGKSEVVFHYSSNVNGTVSETHLCAECAASYDFDSILDLGGIFEDLLPMRSLFGSRGGISGFMPMAIPVVTPERLVPFRVRSQTDAPQKHVAQTCDCRTETKKESVEVDENICRLRELNVELRTAIENEEFEKAAVLRDQIKELKV
ncbi:MAG: UvrB/UvrC motif-containing protein [Oscillospiraceae bacterium]|nr:UvrB/UvrC motif-containing protein [Oscillospiraceae bacterium]MCL2278934.1 UvrB/UvrC motif-containing protein [Oscillospiraceae bacterium]